MPQARVIQAKHFLCTSLMNKMICIPSYSCVYTSLLMMIMTYIFGDSTGHVSVTHIPLIMTYIWGHNTGHACPSDIPVDDDNDLRLGVHPLPDEDRELADVGAVRILSHQYGLAAVSVEELTWRSRHRV